MDTVTSRSPVIRPRPRTNAPPAFVNRSTATRSSQLSVASSRIRVATGAQSALDARRARERADPARLAERVGGPDHHLGGHARVVRALAADEPRVHAHDGQPGPREPGADVLTARPQPDDDDIHLGTRHLNSLRTGRVGTVRVCKHSMSVCPPQQKTPRRGLTLDRAPGFTVVA